MIRFPLCPPFSEAGRLRGLRQDYVMSALKGGMSAKQAQEVSYHFVPDALILEAAERDDKRMAEHEKFLERRGKSANVKANTFATFGGILIVIAFAAVAGLMIKIW